MSSMNEFKIRPKNLNENGKKLLENDLLILQKSKLVKIDCPACKCKDSKFLFKKNNFHFVTCSKCKMVFVNPRPTEKSLEIFYQTSNFINKFMNEIYKKTENVRKEKIFKPRIKLIKKLIKKNNLLLCHKLMDVGSGHGWFCEMAKKYQLANKIIAVEPSPLFADICRKIIGLEVIESTIEKYLQNKKYEKNIDIITNFELISHLFDPKIFLIHCHKTLKKNGLLILTTPNYFGFDIQILGEKSDYVNPLFLNLFNPNSIKLLLESIGFHSVEITTPGLMDIHIVMNKIHSGELLKNNFPILKYFSKYGNENLYDNLQTLFQKNLLSSHMLICAKK